MIVLSLSLMSLPVLHFAVSYWFAKRLDILDGLKSNYAVMYKDWLFVFVNLALAQIDARWELFIPAVVVATAVTAYLNLNWQRAKRAGKETTLFFTDHHLNAVGWTHSGFMILQGALTIVFFMSNDVSAAYFLGLGALLAYFAAYCVIIKYVRKIAWSRKSEMPFIFAGLVLVLGRAILALVEANVR